MIIEVEDRFCKVTKQFLKVLGRLERAAASGDAVHEVEETSLVRPDRGGPRNDRRVYQAAGGRTATAEGDRAGREEASAAAQATQATVCFGLRPDALST